MEGAWEFLLAHEIPGYHVDTQVLVPQWCRPKRGGRPGQVEQAVLDLHVQGPPDDPERYLDVAVRHPVSDVAEEELRLRGSQDGRTARQEEASKRGRYPASRCAVRMTPLVHETYGRMGPAALQYLRQLARARVARDPELQVGGAWAAPALLQRWIGILAVALQRANVASVQWACGERGQCPPVRGSVPQPYELFAERVPGGPQFGGLD